MSEAVVLVGGQGTRLRPLTESVPKPLLPVAGVPFLQHQLERLRDVGVERVVLATSYRSELFTEAFGDGSALGLELVSMTEDQPMGTGGAIRNTAAALTSGPDEPIVILNGDILGGHDLAGQLAAHRAHDADVTLHLVEVEDARAFGCVPTTADGRVTAFLEKMPEPVSNQINAGCYVFRRSVIDAIPADRPVSVERETFPGLLDAGAVVRGFVDTAYWLDLGTPAAYVRGSRDVVLGRVGGVGGDVARESLVLDGARVDAGAEIGGGSTVGADAVVEAGAVVDGSVLLDGAVVRSGGVVRGSVVGARAEVGERTHVVDSVVGDDASTGADNELLAGARLWCGAKLDDATLRFSGTS